MIRPKICLVAENVSVDRDTGEVSAFGLVEGIGSQGYPVFLRRIVFFALLERDAADAQEFAARFTANLNGEDVITHEQPINFGTELRARTVVRINGIVLTAPGKLVLKLAQGNNVIAEYSIDANTLPAPAQPPAAN